jgi:hypothetical protein
MITGYSAHTWELERQRAWTPAFLVACYLAMGLPKDQALQLQFSREEPGSALKRSCKKKKNWGILRMILSSGPL